MVSIKFSGVVALLVCIAVMPNCHFVNYTFYVCLISNADIASQPLETQGMSNHSRLEEIIRRIDQHQRIEKSLAGIQTFR